MFEYKEEYAHPTDICLNITDACNLECRYCFVTQQPHYMTLSTAKDAIQYLINNLHWKQNKGIKKSKIDVNFFGGEPVILWDEIIVPLVRWGWECFPNEIQFGMTTNGTLLTEDRIKFLKAYNFNLLLSIDGAPATQNFNRPCHNTNQASSELVLQNVPYLLKYFPNITFRSTIDENTVNHTFENYIFAQYLGFKNIFMIPNGREEWKQENLDILKSEFTKIYNDQISYFLKDKFPPINFSNINNSFKHLKQHNIVVLNNGEKTKRNCVRCGLGTGFASIGYNGNIYGCQEQNSKEENSPFFLGNIYDGIDTNKHSTFLQEYLAVTKVTCGEHPEYCTNCPLINICGELNCPSSCYDVFQSFAKDHYVHCFYRRTLYNLAIPTLKLLDTNKTFRQYLIKYCNYDFLKEDKKNGL